MTIMFLIKRNVNDPAFVLSTLFSITIVLSSCLFACLFDWTPPIGRKAGTFLSHITTREGLQLELRLSTLVNFQNHY